MMPEVTACLAHAVGARQRWDGLQDGPRRTLRARQIKLSPGQSHRGPGRATQLIKKAETVLPSLIGSREAGENVTSTFISGPPGEGRWPLLPAAFNHPWITAIGTTTIAAVLLAWVFGIT